MLDLAFDIDLAEGFGPCDFEYVASFAGEESKPVFAFFEKSLAVVVVDELRCVAV
jgi:hypothetical protein